MALLQERFMELFRENQANTLEVFAVLGCFFAAVCP